MKYPRWLLILLASFCILSFLIFACGDDDDDWEGDDDEDEEEDDDDWDWGDDDDQDDDDQGDDDQDDDDIVEDDDDDLDDDDSSDDAYEACIEFYTECYGLDESQIEQYCSVMNDLDDGCLEGAYAGYMLCLIENVDCQDLSNATDAIQDCADELIDALADC